MVKLGVLLIFQFYMKIKEVVMFGCSHLYMIDFEESGKKYTTIKCVTCGKTKKVKTKTLVFY